MNIYKQIFIIITCALFSLTALAGQVRHISWDDLVPAHLLAEDPLASLNPEQLDLVVWVINTLDSLPPRGPDTEKLYREVDEAVPQLKNAGINITELMAKRKTLQTSIVEALNGQQVRIPGYLLPLEVSAAKVTEFLLVPYVGACIHVPPPPPNQVIYVKMDQDKSYKSKSLYEPVWVTGIIAAKSMVKDLYMVDGSAGVDIGYSMQSNHVEPYKE
ncbi:FIG003461: hypothetical protein [Olavius algarvensis Delta 1 endosymbiont]|nr:FIG003461: hypothetical protein [Olavius algarvensis Delta 1 endosymbiont]